MFQLGSPPQGFFNKFLKQIDHRNVTLLRTAWIYHTQEVADEKKYPDSTAFECTPLMVDGILYLTTPTSRLIALEACGFRAKWGTDSDGKWGGVTAQVGRGFDGK